jgi:hypothetical protein
MTTNSRESIIAAELQRLAGEHGGVLQPSVVVESARDPQSPLHSNFEWDDTQAAHQWRLEQARNLIRVVVRFEQVGDKAVPVRVFVSLSPDRKGDDGGYRLAVDVFSDAELRRQLLVDARAEMQRFRNKYQSLAELAQVFEAMDRVE